MTTEKAAKTELRRAALARRDALDVDWRISASLDIAETLHASLRFDPGTVISGFWPMRSEVDLRPLLHALREEGARLCLPAILDRETIIFRELVADAPMIDMGFGTMGPGPDAAVLDPDIMLIPLAAFDARGHRIGYGGGYYDRAIARLQAKGADPRLIGVAYDCQQVPLVPNEWHDIHLPELLTESGLRRTGQSKS